MEVPSNRSEKVTRNVVWDADDWDKLVRAAEKLGERERLNLNPTDIIRSGALRRAEEILDTQQTAA